MFLSSLIYSAVGDPVTLILTGITFILVYYLYNYNDRSYPEGPFQYPLIGNIPQIAAAGDMVTFLKKYKQIYGDVFTIRVGGLNRVVISGEDNIKKLLIEHADHTSSRTNSSMTKEIQEATRKAPGIFWAPHPYWKTMRTFALNQLREEGMGKSRMEVKIMEEANLFIEHFLEPSIGSPIEMSLVMTFLTSNIISQLVLGRRFDYTDPALAMQNEKIVEVIKINFRASITSNLWFLRYLPGDVSGKKQSAENQVYLQAIRAGWIKEIREHQNTDCYLGNALEYADQQREDGRSELVFNENSVAMATFHMYLAGTDTTATALKWALLYMILYPDIQDRVRTEIKDQIGEREASMKDRLSMPYTDAVLHEVLRIGNIVPTALPHTLTEQVELNDKIIPANSELLINLSSVLQDEKTFPAPEVFKPERFMGEEGKALKSSALTFGVGRRVCLGEPLARMELFLFFTTFLQKYRVSHPENEKPTTVPNFTFVNGPQKYRIIFEKA